MTTDQQQAPILEALKEHERKNSVSFAPPGHEAGKGAPHDIRSLLGSQVFKGDAAELKGIDDRHPLIILTAGTDAKAARRLVSALERMVQWARSDGARRAGRPADMPRHTALRSELVGTPSEAFYGRAEEVPLDRAAGRVAAEIISFYSPGIPGVLPGERITDAHVAFPGAGLRAGAYVMDARVANDAVVRVVA